MAAVQRYEIGTIRFDAKNRTPQGFLICDAALARAGNVQEYLMPDGSIRREYRPHEEVFKADSLAMAARLPITFTPDTWNWHPQEKVTPENVRKYSVGVTGDQVKQDGEWVKTTALIMDADAIKAAESGEFQSLSCGYWADFDPTPGKSPAGEPYDGVQRNICHNHVAMVRAGRAGPGARLRLDAQDNAVLAPPSNGGSSPMEKITINGVTFEVSSQVAQAINAKFKADADAFAAKEKVHADAVAAAEKGLKDAKAELDKTKADADANKVKLDSATKKLEEAEKAHKDAADPKKVQALIAARVSLEGQARSILGEDEKIAEKTDSEVKRLVVAKAFPDLKLDGKSDEYVGALFDRAVADVAEDRHPMAGARRVIDPNSGKGARQDGDQDPDNEDDDVEMTADAAYQEMQKRNRAAARPKKTDRN
jgi:hypothetical protein